MLTISIFQDYLKQKGLDEHFEYANTYGEPGYAHPEQGIIFYNWNDVDDTISEQLEQNGFALEWSDEWMVDHNDNGKAYRTQSDCHNWQPSFLLNEWTNHEIMGKDSIVSDPEDYLDEYLANDSNVADKFNIDLKKYGYTKLEEGVKGLHPHQTDDPAAMLRAAQDSQTVPCIFVFQIDGSGQFETNFSLWIKSEDT